LIQTAARPSLNPGAFTRATQTRARSMKTSSDAYSFCEIVLLFFARREKYRLICCRCCTDFPFRSLNCQFGTPLGTAFPTRLVESAERDMPKLLRGTSTKKEFTRARMSRFGFVPATRSSGVLSLESEVTRMRKQKEMGLLPSPCRREKILYRSKLANAPKLKNDPRCAWYFFLEKASREAIFRQKIRQRARVLPCPGKRDIRMK